MAKNNFGTYALIAILLMMFVLAVSSNTALFETAGHVTSSSVIEDTEVTGGATRLDFTAVDKGNITIDNATEDMNKELITGYNQRQLIKTIGLTILYILIGVSFFVWALSKYKKPKWKKIIIIALIVGIVLVSGCIGGDDKITGEAIADFTCNKPYILVGNTCCLDKNYNNICDKDEGTFNEYQETDDMCTYAYKNTSV